MVTGRSSSRARPSARSLVAVDMELVVSLPKKGWRLYQACRELRADDDRSHRGRSLALPPTHRSLGMTCHVPRARNEREGVRDARGTSSRGEDLYGRPN